MLARLYHSRTGMEWSRMGGVEVRAVSNSLSLGVLLVGIAAEIIAAAFCCFSSNYAEANELDLPYELSWGMPTEEVRETFLDAGFSVLDEVVPGFPGTEKQKRTTEALKAYGFTRLSFSDDGAIPKMRVYVLLYQEKLYSLIFRYENASTSVKEKILEDLSEQFGETTGIKDNGISVYGWKTSESVIVFSFTEDQGNPFSNLTRLSFTDLRTKQKLGPGSP